MFALTDTAYAYACNSRNVASVAQAATICFIDSARSGERLVAQAQERAVRGWTGVYSVAVRGGDVRVVAEFQGQSRAAGGRIIEED